MSTSSSYKSYDGVPLEVGQLVYTIFISPSDKSYHIKQYRVKQLVDAPNTIVIEITGNDSHINVVSGEKVHSNPEKLVETWIKSLSNDISELQKRIEQLKSSLGRYLDQKETI